MAAESVMSRTRRLPDAAARMVCYALGPVSAAWMLYLRQYGAVWSIRFHAFHSILMTGAWALIWSALRGVEAAFPWFLATTIRELRFATNLAFALIWVFLLATAYGGGRCATIPFVHGLAVRLARRNANRFGSPSSSPL
jgi:uncharacterized membrane protein